MAKKKPRKHPVAHMTAGIAAKWEMEREAKRKAYKRGVRKGVYKEKEVIQVTPIDPRKDPYTIDHINNRLEVDIAINCLVWPTKQYERKADFYFQDLISPNDKIMDYYHKKMIDLFGVEHILKSERSDLSKNSKIRIPGRQTIRIKVDRTTQTNTTNVKEDKKPVVPKVQESEITRPTSWILDWECVDFYDGYFIVNTPNKGIYNFAPLRIGNPKVRSSFNYIRKYIKEKVPTIFCTIIGGKLSISSPILIDEAILTFQRVARQKGLIMDSKESNTALEQDSFKKALSKAAQMTPEEFKKYKSKYIDYLVNHQSKTHKILPCVERLAHSTGEMKEQAFIFTFTCKSGNILIVHENVNPDRSTLLFFVKKESYEISIRHIYDFLQGTDINKRSGIRDKSIICFGGIINYCAIDHDDINTWKKAIDWHISKAIHIPRMENDIMKVKFHSLSKLLREIQAPNNFKKVEHIFSLYSLPLTRKVKPAEFLARIPESAYPTDENGHKKLPVREDEWSVEVLIKMLEGK